MLDYEAYIGAYTDLNSVQEYLKKRAKLSVVLQTLESDMEKERRNKYSRTLISSKAFSKVRYFISRNEKF